MMMNAVFAADAEIGSDAVFAADAEISSDAVFAADSGLGSDAVFAADSGLNLYWSDSRFCCEREREERHAAAGFGRRWVILSPLFVFILPIQ